MIKLRILSLNVASLGSSNNGNGNSLSYSLLLNASQKQDLGYIIYAWSHIILVMKPQFYIILIIPGLLQVKLNSTESSVAEVSEEGTK